MIIEAMACGTPVVAYNIGAIPELIENGVTGFVVEDEISAVGAITTFPRSRVAKCVQRLSNASNRMTLDYLRAYQNVCQSRRPEKGAPPRLVTN